MGFVDLVKSVFGGGSGAPSRRVAELDPETKNLINKYSGEGLRPTEDFEKEAMANVAESFAAPQQNEQQFKAQEESGFAMSPFFAQAIREKYQQSANDELSRITNQSNLQAQMQKGAELQRGMNLSLAERNVAIKNMQAMAQAQMDANRIRAQVLSSVFGAAGTVVGMGVKKGWFNSGVTAPPTEVNSIGNPKNDSFFTESGE